MQSTQIGGGARTFSLIALLLPCCVQFCYSVHAFSRRRGDAVAIAITTRILTSGWTKPASLAGPALTRVVSASAGRARLGHETIVGGSDVAREPRAARGFWQSSSCSKLSSPSKPTKALWLLHEDRGGSNPIEVRLQEERAPPLPGHDEGPQACQINQDALLSDDLLSRRARHCKKRERYSKFDERCGRHRGAKALATSVPHEHARASRAPIRSKVVQNRPTSELVQTRNPSFL